MPKKPINYQNTVIYKIVCTDINITDLYIGSTTNLIQRRRSHRSGCKNQNGTFYNYKVYKFIREHGNWINWTVVKIEDYPCSNLEDSNKRERHWIDQSNATLNCVIPCHSPKEYYQQHKEQQKEYNEQHKEQKKEYDQQYYQHNKVKINNRNKIYKQQHKEQKKKTKIYLH